MDRKDKNIIMITAGGVGKRFGADIPKQYVLLDGKPVLSYVIKACKESKLADSILVVAAEEYLDEIRETYDVDVTCGGEELNITKRNGFDYIKKNSSCQKLVVVEGVRPFVEASVIDRTFELLDDYDAVACARKITDSLGHYGEWIVNRADYYTLNPPEGFNFPMLDVCFEPTSVLTESIQQLPESAKVYLNFDVPYYDKITYPEDLVRASAMMQWRKQK